MKQRLTEEQFLRAIRNLDVGPQTIEIARGVLVDGKPQALYVTQLGLSKGAVSQAVRRVRAAHDSTNLPPGYERVTAVLPEHQAYIVKKWAENAARKLAPDK